MLDAKLLPLSSNTKDKPKILIYVVTGKHGLLKIPESYCKECNMFYQAAKKAKEKVDFEVDIEVRSYWTGFLPAVIKGGTHPPVMIINGKLISQGYDVPVVEEIVNALED